MPLHPKTFLSLDINKLDNIQELNSCDSCEVTPRVEHYLRTFDYNFKSRPTVERLHSSSSFNIDDDFEDNRQQKKSEGFQIKDEDKFGMFSMVYVPTFMNLLGTTLYLRIGFIVGEAGILLALLQVLIGAIILTLTVLSMSAICTNGNVGNGGFYFLISRSLGPEIGAMFGCIYFLTNAIMVAFSIIGVCLEIQYILQSLDTGIVEYPSASNDQRIVGLITLIIVSFIPFISLEFETKSQWVLFALVIISLLDFFIGLIIPPTDYQRAYGIEGWTKEVISTNLLPLFDHATFFSIFSLYTSTIAGDFTGMTMASTLKNPNADIPKGSILAIVTSTLVYALEIIFFGCTSNRYSTGNISDVLYKNQTCSGSQEQQCNYGLIPDQYIMSRASALTIFGDKINYIEPLFAAGLLAQSLSSAMSSFISAPKILQSLGFDQLLPLTKWFSKGTGKHDDPRRGYILTFLISLVFIAIADFDIIANVISNCYLCSWFLLNLAVFHSDYVGSVNWRPTFRYYNKWLSLLCGVICFVLMFCFDWISSLCLLAIMAIIWIIICYYKPDVNWGQTLDAQLFKSTVAFAHRLNQTSDHVKNFRPSVLLLCGLPKNYTHLISIANDITRHRGMLIIGDVVNTQLLYENRDKTIRIWGNWLKQRNIKCFYRIINANSISEGSNMMIQCCGLGSNLSPNIVMIGFKESWRQSTYEDVIDYFNIIHHVLHMEKSLIIFRNNESNRSEKTSETNSTNFDSNNNSVKSNQTKSSIELIAYQSYKVFSLQNLKGFSQSNFIDIYWLYDDGGLTLLIPYLISQRKKWRKYKLRIFTVIENSSISAEQNMRDLLNKFRIEYFDVKVLVYPKNLPIKNINEILVYIENNSLFFDQNSKREIIDSFYNFEAKTYKYLALRQLLESYSKYSSLIVMTLEIPKKDLISAHLFMYWLDVLSSEMPHFLFIRGNQKNVLTFYCD